ncbi:kinase-like domain-containing protein [Obelidium mucronatum]|nr:kinase-like domain-containing protein [Obelidium mucronatum]
MNKEFLKSYTPNPILLGHGGFGFVTTAVRNHDLLEVAVKFILKEKVPSNAWAREPALGLVPTEVYILKNVSHPNIIKYLDYFEDEMYLYLVTELHGGAWGAPQPPIIKPTTPESTTAPLPPLSPASSTSTLDSCETLVSCETAVTAGNGGNIRVISKATSTGTVQEEQVNTTVLSESGAAVAAPSMERRNSYDLFECIEFYQRFSEDQARHVFRQIVSAVAHLEANRIIHRDIKDENILIDREFNVKLIDFGSATVLDDNGKVRDGLFLGTLQYAAPEILSGKPSLGSQCEVWSLGCCLYIMLAGEAPFESPKDVVRLERPMAPRNVTLSHSVTTLITWMLEKNPRNRATVKDVLRHPWVVNNGASMF